MRELFDGIAEIQIRICSNGWIVYAVDPVFDRQMSSKAFVFDTAERLGTFIHEQAGLFEKVRDKKQ